MYRTLWSALLLAAAACDNQSPVASDQSIAEDSLLAAEVMSARGDSNFFGPVDDRVYTEDLAEKKVSPKPKPVPVIANPKAVPKQVPLLADVSVPLSEMPRKVEREEKPVRTGIISPGARLAVVTGERACGKTFHGALVSSLRGSNDVVIPSGATAIGEILAADKWGSGLSVRIRSVRHGGRSYTVNSGSASVLVEVKNGETCIPGSTRIDVKTTESLRVASAN
jgi:hypothetical protein